MTPSEGRVIALNPAQLRGLSNWSVAERPAKSVEVVVPTPSEPSPDRVEELIVRLARTHEALRSRLVRDSSGHWRQLVRDPDAVEAEPSFDTTEIPSDVDPATLMAGLGPQLVDPERHSMRCLAYTRRGKVLVVLLSVSHIFADGVSQQLLNRTLYQALRDGTDIPLPSCQASDFAGDRIATAVRENTAAWKVLLADAPRNCVYTGAARDDVEEIRAAQRTLPKTTVVSLPRACRGLGVTPYMLWATATNALVSRYTGQQSMVFKTQMANRTRPVEFEAVAQLAQAAFIPVSGDERDTLADRARAVFEASMRAHGIGIHDSLELLRWLDLTPLRKGAAFRPAFEINYGASIRGARLPQVTHGARSQEFRERQRMDPNAAAADLAVAVWQEPGATVVTVRTKPPVWAVRSPALVLDDLMSIVESLCGDADVGIAELPVDALPGRHRLTRLVGGMDIDDTMMRRLLTSHPGVTSVRYRPTGEATSLSAALVTDRPVTEAELHRTYTERQRWLDGTVVPADLAVSVVDEGASA